MMKVVFTYKKSSEENSHLTKMELTDIEVFWNLKEVLESELWGYEITILNAKRLNIDNHFCPINFAMALEIAECDYSDGILSAMEMLSKFGVNTSYYFNTMSNIEYEDIDNDNLNINTRDKQYELLGIKDLMEFAYSIIWE